MAWPDCDVCGGEAKGVASSILGAISLAYCQECLDNNSDAAWLFEGIWDDIGKDASRLAPWVLEMTTVVDGERISASTFFETLGQSTRDGS